jgi:hypothetical protein
MNHKKIEKNLKSQIGRKFQQHINLAMTKCGSYYKGLLQLKQKDNEKEQWANNTKRNFICCSAYIY